MLQYWLFYPYNHWSPVVPQSPEFWQVHEGDWEEVSVLLDTRARPLGVGASRHCAGVRRAWAGVPKRGARPVVHVSLGSHANGFRSGTSLVDPKCWPKEGVAVYKAYGIAMLDHAGAGRMVSPALVRVTATARVDALPGHMGRGPVRRLPERGLPLRRRPAGPAQKAVWRDPLAGSAGRPADRSVFARLPRRAAARRRLAAVATAAAQAFGVRSMTAPLRRALLSAPATKGDLVAAGWRERPDPDRLRAEHEAFAGCWRALAST